MGRSWARLASGPHTVNGFLNDCTHLILDRDPLYTQRVRRRRRRRPPARAALTWAPAPLRRSSSMRWPTTADRAARDPRGARARGAYGRVRGGVCGGGQEGGGEARRGPWAGGLGHKPGTGDDPIFLKTEKRIAALGLVYLLALMVYALIQRHARRALADANEVVPGNRGVTAKPTTAVLFKLVHGIDVLRPTPGTAHAVVTRITEPQLDALRLLRHPLLEDPCVRISAPHAPRRARDKTYANWRQKQRAQAGENGASSSAIP